MISLTQINKQKLISMLIRSSLIILVQLLIIFLIAYFNNALPNTTLIISIFAFGCIILPLVIILIGFLVWNITQRRKTKIYNKLELDKIGFTDKQINEESFWKLNESIKTKKIDDYTIAINLSETNSNQLEIEVPLRWRKVDKNEFKILDTEFKSQDIELRIGCIVKKVNIKSLLTNYDSENFNNNLNALITFIKAKGFKPAD